MTSIAKTKPKRESKIPDRDIFSGPAYAKRATRSSGTESKPERHASRKSSRSTSANSSAKLRQMMQIMSEGSEPGSSEDEDVGNGKDSSSNGSDEDVIFKDIEKKESQANKRKPLTRLKVQKDTQKQQKGNQKQQKDTKIKPKENQRQTRGSGKKITPKKKGSDEEEEGGDGDEESEESEEFQEDESSRSDSSEKSFSSSEASDDEDDGKDDKAADEDSSNLIDIIIAKKLPALGNFENDESTTDQPLIDGEPGKDEAAEPVKVVKKGKAKPAPSPQKGPKPLYLVKGKFKSYLSAQWLTKHQMNRLYTNVNYQLQKFDMNPDAQVIEHDDKTVLFNPDFTKIDRIVAVKGSGSNMKLFVKWKSLSYDDCTWENMSELSKLLGNVKEKIEQFEYINSPEAMKIANREKPRPKPGNFDESALELPTFKPGHELKDYQKEGFRWLVHSWVHKRNTILADEMGLGKTIQAVAILQYLFTEQDKSGPFLIITPMSTIEQWKRETEEWTDMNAILFHGNVDSRNMIYNEEWFFHNEKHKKSRTLKFHVLITTYEIAMVESRRLSSVPWEYLVVDEGHRIKSADSKLAQTLRKFTAAHKLLLTGTPLQNGVKELWALMNFLEPKKFNNCDQFMEEFGDLKESTQVKKLHQVLGPYMLRRIKEDVASFIPKKEETLIEIELTAVQKTYYKAILERNKDFLQKAAKSSLMNIMMELRKCCNHPYLIKGAEESISAGIDQNNDAQIYEKLIACSSKFVFVDRLLERLRKTEHRVLIFSQMTRVLDLLEDYLRYKEYPFERLDGGVNRTDRQAAIDRFSNTELDRFVFLLGTKAGGLGINLTIADTVILFDSDWNPQNDLQAQARAHRIGQENTVKIYRLITRNTYEKKMFVVASKKLGLDKVVLGKKEEDTEDGLVKGMSKEQMERVLKYGAYELFNNGEETKVEEFDLDRVIAASTKVDYQQANKSTELSSFSKATFVADEAEDNVDLDDVNFWEKILPSFKTASKMKEALRDETTLDTEEKREAFIKDIESLVTDLAIQRQQNTTYSSFDPSNELLSLLRKAKSINKFSEEQLQTFANWAEAIEKPRLRKRKERMLRRSSLGEDAARSDDDEEFKEVIKRHAKSLDKEAKKAEKEEKSKNNSKYEWGKAQRDRFRTALNQFGFGRWEAIAEAARISRSEPEIQSFGEALLQVMFESTSHSSVIAQVVEDETAYVKDQMKDAKALVTERHDPPKDSVKLAITNGNEENRFYAASPMTISWEGSDLPPHSYLLISKENKKEYIRFIKMEESDSKTATFIVPGFTYDKYSARLYSVRALDTQTPEKGEGDEVKPAIGGGELKKKLVKLSQTLFFEVLKPLILTEEAAKQTSMNSQKVSSNKLDYMRKLNKIAEKYDKNFDEVKIPVLRLRKPADWWTNEDDVKLIKGFYRYGYGRVKEMQEDEDFKWDPETIAQRKAEVKDSEKSQVQKAPEPPKEKEEQPPAEGDGEAQPSKEEKDELFPLTNNLTKRFNRLVDEMYETMLRKDIDEPQTNSGKPPRKKRAPKVAPAVTLGTSTSHQIPLPFIPIPHKIPNKQAMLSQYMEQSVKAPALSISSLVNDDDFKPKRKSSPTSSDSHPISGASNGTTPKEQPDTPSKKQKVISHFFPTVEKRIGGEDSGRRSETDGPNTPTKRSRMPALETFVVESPSKKRGAPDVAATDEEETRKKSKLESSSVDLT